MSGLSGKRIAVLSGAGVSAESGLKTFRDSDGLWEGYAIEEVATPQAWQKNPKTVLEFYNQRRQAVRVAEPNAAHYALAELEESFDVTVITQNIDDLHERAGSSKVLHLHGEILKSRSSIDPDLIYPLGIRDIELGELCERRSQLRPHVVWFGEAVPAMEKAMEVTAQADVFLIVGTSLAVYPAAGLAEYAAPQAVKFLIDPKPPIISYQLGFTVLAELASVAVPLLVQRMLVGEFDQ